MVNRNNGLLSVAVRCALLDSRKIGEHVSGVQGEFLAVLAQTDMAMSFACLSQSILHDVDASIDYHFRYSTGESTSVADRAPIRSLNFSPLA